MKIYCDYCGAQIDTDKNATCPSCGGSYSNDRELLEEKVRLEKLNGLDIEKRQLEIERMRLENDALKNKGRQNKALPGCLIPVVIILCLLGVLFISIFVFAVIDEETRPQEKSNTSERTKISYSVSMTPVELPEIPEINIPDIEVTVTSVPTVSVPSF